jgi:lysophospholipid acyltransferase (LPLAT)-like uncharacterized protein
MRKLTALASLQEIYLKLIYLTQYEHYNINNLFLKSFNKKIIKAYHSGNAVINKETKDFDTWYENRQ